MRVLIFKILAKKYPNKALFVPNLSNYFFHESFLLSKFEGAELKYYNSFLKIFAQNYPNKAFLVPKLGLSLFTKFYNETNLRVLTSKRTKVF